jgi:hypothetical protein
MIAVITFNAIPAANHTFKYDRLGRMAIENRRIYCERQGYRFISEVPIAADRPACWAKIPAILEAFAEHRWVLWADSDALVFDLDRRLEDFCDPSYDMVVASHEEFFRLTGVPLAAGLERMPINTGVFLMQASPWSSDFLRRAYDQRQLVSQGEIWNGIGEQEAMTLLLQQRPEDRRRIKYVEGLQNHPKLYRPRDTFVHFYGNYARHRIPAPECEEVLCRWEDATRRGAPFPPDRARFHWCCIQNKQPGVPADRGDVSRYLYRPEDIEAPAGGPA